MPVKFWLLTAGCSMLPDLDVISFAFGIRYNHVLGHRGITHSLLFALVLGLVVSLIFFREIELFSINWWLLTGYFFLITASHALLDAMTNGGLGVAFFAPFDNQRYFLPWRPIEVSPIGLEAFLSARGLTVLLSEIKWIWIPAAFLVGIAEAVRRLK
jgi:inner membrane protein